MSDETIRVEAEVEGRRVVLDVPLDSPAGQALQRMSRQMAEHVSIAPEAT